VKVLIAYFSRTGNTAKMAEAVAAGVRSAGADAVLKEVGAVSLQDMKEANGIIVGSPTYYGLMAAEVKQLFDRSSEVRGDLEGKIGAAFTTSASFEGGNQTTLLSILNAMLIHGMIVAGDPLESGGHYGAIAVGEPGSEALQSAKLLGSRVAMLAEKLSR
jgi:NAD(P)H dehydrogenase (quinone)